MALPLTSKEAVVSVAVGATVSMTTLLNGDELAESTLFMVCFETTE